MTQPPNRKIPWEDIGKPLEDLLRYERAIGHYEHASHQLLSTLVHHTGSPAWRAFLLQKGRFAAIVEQVLALANKDNSTPNAALEAIQAIVEATHAHSPEQAVSFLDAYLGHRPHIPLATRGRLDQFAVEGHTSVPLCAAAFAAEVERARPVETRNKIEEEVFEYWCDRIAREEITESKARLIPAQILEAETRLWEHQKETTPELREEKGEEAEIDKTILYTRYRDVFTSSHILDMTDLVLATQQFRRPVPAPELEPFLENHSREEALPRLEQINAWLEQVNQQNHDGVYLTPLLLGHLARPAPIESLIDELEHLRAETRAGRFDLHNKLQKDLEYCRFSTEYNWQLEGAGATPDHYALFAQLPELPPQEEEAFELDGQHLVEVRRIAYEAVGFLRFLREFRRRTSRPIVVVGNDRYGRQWVVEPLEEYLRDGFEVRYFRNPSHKSMRLTVRHELFHSIRMGFTRDFVLELNRYMPHVVIADSCNPSHGNTLMRLSRGTRDYLNWFMAFNDIRAGGDESRYEAISSLPPEYLSELKKWYEFTRVRRQLQDWVEPGLTYKVAHWAPVLKEKVRLGDYEVPRKDPDLDDDGPQVILTNPAIYPDDNNEIPEFLHGTNPYYFDGPERYAKEELIFGFGSYGFETRLQGTTTDTFVAAVQRHAKMEIARLLQEMGD